MNTTPTPQAYEVLDALPEALRNNVRAYAARRLHVLEWFLEKQAKRRGDTLEGILKELETGGAELAEAGITIEKGGIKLHKDLGSTLQFLARASRQNAPHQNKFYRMVYEIAEQGAANSLVNDKRLGTILTDLNRHFGQHNPEVLEKLVVEAMDSANKLRQSDPGAFEALRKTKIAPVIEEMAAKVTKVTDYKKLAFGVVAGVVAGIVTGKLMFGGKQAEPANAASR